jgi:hypothetical protein
MSVCCCMFCCCDKHYRFLHFEGICIPIRLKANCLHLNLRSSLFVCVLANGILKNGVPGRVQSCLL